jgi:hypothetical protein
MYDVHRPRVEDGIRLELGVLAGIPANEGSFCVDIVRVASR